MSLARPRRHGNHRAVYKKTICEGAERLPLAVLPLSSALRPDFQDGLPLNGTSRDRVGDRKPYSCWLANPNTKRGIWRLPNLDFAWHSALPTFAVDEEESNTVVRLKANTLNVAGEAGFAVAGGIDALVLRNQHGVVITLSGCRRGRG
jgi:hypothetical protein